MTKKEIEAINTGIMEEINISIQNLISVRAARVADLVGKKAGEVIDSASSIVNDIEAIVRAPRVDGVGLPDFVLKVMYSGEETGIQLTIKTRLKSAYKYRADLDVDFTESFVSDVANFVVKALFDMRWIESAVENVAVLNEKLDGIFAENPIPYKVHFGVDWESSSPIISITDEEIVFNTDLTEALDIANLSIFCSGDEYSDLVASKAVTSLVEGVSAAQTPVQLIKAKVPLIMDLTQLKTKKRASKLIRTAYHRQAKYLGRVNKGIGYFDEDVEIDGKTVEVFSLVSKAEDGTFSVILSPFDVKTLLNVEYDVVGAVKEMQA